MKKITAQFKPFFCCYFQRSQSSQPLIPSASLQEKNPLPNKIEKNCQKILDIFKQSKIACVILVIATLVASLQPDALAAAGGLNHTDAKDLNWNEIFSEPNWQSILYGQGAMLICILTYAYYFICFFSTISKMSNSYRQGNISLLAISLILLLPLLPIYITLEMNWPALKNNVVLDIITSIFSAIFLYQTRMVTTYEVYSTLKQTRSRQITNVNTQYNKLQLPKTIFSYTLLGISFALMPTFANNAALGFEQTNSNLIHNKLWRYHFRWLVGLLVSLPNQFFYSIASRDITPLLVQSGANIYSQLKQLALKNNSLAKKSLTILGCIALILLTSQAAVFSSLTLVEIVKEEIRHGNFEDIFDVITISEDSLIAKILAHLTQISAIFGSFGGALYATEKLIDHMLTRSSTQPIISTNPYGSFSKQDSEAEDFTNTNSLASFTSLQINN